MKRKEYRPRVIIGKRKGIKVKSRHPSQMGGYIYHTFNSIEQAKKYFRDQSSWARRRAKVWRVDNGKEINVK